MIQTTTQPDAAREEETEAARLFELIDALELGHLEDFEDHLTLTVAEDFDIQKLRDVLPDGVTADWNGNSNTDAYGDTTEDIRIEWE